jgi:hypothetical protein
LLSFKDDNIPINKGAVLAMKEKCLKNAKECIENSSL